MQGSRSLANRNMRSDVKCVKHIFWNSPAMSTPSCSLLSIWALASFICADISAMRPDEAAARTGGHVRRDGLCVLDSAGTACCDGGRFA